MGFPTRPQEVGGKELGPCMVMGLQHVTFTCLNIPRMGGPTTSTGSKGKGTGTMYGDVLTACTGLGRWGM